MKASVITTKATGSLQFARPRSVAATGSATASISGGPSEQPRGPDQEHDRHDDEDHGVGGLREKYLGQPSTRPRPKPVRIAPMIEPMPPITTTANTTMMRLAPISGL